jgi:hypothetical protein
MFVIVVVSATAVVLLFYSYLEVPISFFAHQGALQPMLGPAEQ